MIGKEKQYLLFRGDYSGVCIITTIEFISLSVKGCSENYYKSYYTFKIHCNSHLNAMELVHKLKYNNCGNIESIIMQPETKDGVDVVLIVDFDFGLEGTIKNFFPSCFLLFDCIEGMDKYSLELLFEAEGTF